MCQSLPIVQYTMTQLRHIKAWVMGLYAGPSRKYGFCVYRAFKNTIDIKLSNIVIVIGLNFLQYLVAMETKN